jgi:hypothetical protein
MRLSSVVSVVFVAVVAASALAQQPVPSEDAQTEALTLLREVYKDEYAQAKTAEQKADLARKMIQKAAQTRDDPPSHYILLRVARDLAIQAGYADVALLAVDRISATYDVDEVKMKAEAVERLPTFCRTPQQNETLAGVVTPLMEACLAADKVQEASELSQIALGAARATRKKEVLTEAIARNKHVQEMVTVYERVKTAHIALESSPTDPEANLIVGKHLCFIKGDWEKGLSMLARGSDDRLKALAVKELEGVKDAPDQVKLGDGWRDVAEGEKVIGEKQIQDRAVYWYRKALPGLTGLMKDKAEGRLKDISGQPSTPTTQSPQSRAVVSKEWRHFVGQWNCGDAVITLNADFTAHKNKSNPLGKWEYVNGEAHIVWNDGTRTILRREGQGFLKLTWPPGASLQALPNPKWTFPAVKTRGH